jgi:hypothetical protein
MALLASRMVLIAADGFADPAVPQAIATAYGNNVVWLSRPQKNAFPANAITVGPTRVWMSTRAAEVLDPVQKRAIEQAGFALADVELDEIEKAGGSLRCCVAEIF